jgi:predicted ester cyclase
MGVKENIKISELIDKAVEKRDWNAFSKYHTDSVVSYSPFTAQPAKGIEAHRKSVESFMNAFPDFRMEGGLTFGDGDWLCMTFTFTGTHTGPMTAPDGKTIPPTNKPVRMEIATVGRFEDGKLAEEHTYFDRLSMLAQLGIKP